MIQMLFTVILSFLSTFLFIKLLKNMPIRGPYKSTNNFNLPPVVKSWPLVGPLYMLLNDPVKLLKEQYKRHGSVFTMKMLGLNVTMLIGPEESKHFFTVPDSELSQEEIYQFTIPLFGQTTLYALPAPKRRQQIQFISNGVKPQKLRSYVGQMVTEAKDYFSKWGDCGTIDLMYELEHLSTLMVSRCLLGREVRENLQEDVCPLIRELHDSTLPISMLFPYLPIPAHYRRGRAIVELNRIFSNITNSRKSSKRSEEDLLQTLIESRYNDGESNTNEQVTGLLIAALFASQINTTKAAVWTGIYLLQNKSHLSKALDEQMALVRRHELEINFDILGEMDVLYCCIREVNRLRPPAIIIPRYCRKEFTITTTQGKKYMIPKGHILCTSPPVANRLDYVYIDPDRYDPNRYLSQRKEEITRQPFSYITFGAGRHACTGEAFTYTLVKIIWSYLIRNFELDIVSSFPDGEWNGKDKVLVSYKRREISI